MSQPPAVSGGGFLITKPGLQQELTIQTSLNDVTDGGPGEVWGDRVSLCTPIWPGIHDTQTGLGPKVSFLLLFSRVWSLAGVLVKCEPPDLSAGSCTWVLRKKT